MTEPTPLFAHESDSVREYIEALNDEMAELIAQRESIRRQELSHARRVALGRIVYVIATVGIMVLSFILGRTSN